MTIASTIRSFHLPLRTDPHHRYRSWEHCYSYFRNKTPKQLIHERDHAALQLGFYLASWGMYRGSSFLLQHAYTIHRGVIDLLADDKVKPLWKYEYGTGVHDNILRPVILDVIHAIKAAYKPFAPAEGSQQPTDTLVSKIILGTFGSLPACDRYFIDGFKKCDLPFSSLNQQFIQRISDFCTSNHDELSEMQTEIQELTGFRYPMMKLADMYFWQIGYEVDMKKTTTKVASDKSHTL